MAALKILNEHKPLISYMKVNLKFIEGKILNK
jgi:hypothetical protein